MAEYFSDVKNAKLQKNIYRRIEEDLPQFEGKRVRILIEKLKIKRSDAQNRLFHMYCDIIAKELGYDPEEMKDILKYKFLLIEKVDETTGEIFHYLGHTSKLNKSDFAELVDKVIRFASGLGIVLPLPGENFEMNI